MTRRKTRPDGALVVETYEKLEQYAQGFSAGHFNLLIIVGGAGIAKSQTIKRAVGQKSLWIEGSATAFGIYTELYQHQGKSVVLDDVDGLYSDKAAVNLLKQLAQTDPVKSISWFSNSVGDGKSVPRSFETTSSTILIANDWKTLSQHVFAVQNRGHLLFFEPSLAEIHSKVAEWYDDEEIFAWVGNNLSLLPSLTMRHYVRASELKRAGMNWFDAFIDKNLSEKTLLVAKLKADESLTENQRIKAFSEQGGGGRTTYFNHAKKLRAKGKVKPLDIPLKRAGQPKLRVIGR